MSEALKVRDLMHTPAVTVSAAITLSEAARILDDRRVGAAAVVADGGQLTGIVTERDVLRTVGHGIDPHNTTVGEVMTSEPVSVGAERAGGASARDLPGSALPAPSRGGERRRRRHPVDPSRGPGRPHRGGAARRSPAAGAGPARARGRGGRRDLGWRRPRRGGLLPLPGLRRHPAGAPLLVRAGLASAAARHPSRPAAAPRLPSRSGGGPAPARRRSTRSSTGSPGCPGTPRSRRCAARSR